MGSALFEDVFCCFGKQVVEGKTNTEKQAGSTSGHFLFPPFLLRHAGLNFLWDGEKLPPLFPQLQKGTSDGSFTLQAYGRS